MVVRQIKLPISCLKIESLINFESTLAESFSAFSIGVDEFLQSTIVHLSNRPSVDLCCEAKIHMLVYQTSTPKQ